MIRSCAARVAHDRLKESGMKIKGTLLVVAVVVLTSLPAEARTNDERDTWIDARRENFAKIVRVVKNVKRAIISLGDGLTDPKP
jgi:hypothetical protein